LGGSGGDDSRFRRPIIRRRVRHIQRGGSRRHRRFIWRGENRLGLFRGLFFAGGIPGGPAGGLGVGEIRLARLTARIALIAWRRH
jgi:hypothetical protein